MSLEGQKLTKLFTGNNIGNNGNFCEYKDSLMVYRGTKTNLENYKLKIKFICSIFTGKLLFVAYVCTNNTLKY